MQTPTLSCLGASKFWRCGWIERFCLTLAIVVVWLLCWAQTLWTRIVVGWAWGSLIAVIFTLVQIVSLSAFEVDCTWRSAFIRFLLRRGFEVRAGEFWRSFGKNGLTRIFGIFKGWKAAWRCASSSLSVGDWLWGYDAPFVVQVISSHQMTVEAFW